MNEQELMDKLAFLIGFFEDYNKMLDRLTESCIKNAERELLQEYGNQINQLTYVSK